MKRIIIVAQAVLRIMGKINTVLAALCGLVVFLYMFLVAVNITGRYLLNSPVNGTLEIGQLVLAAVIFFGLGYSQMKDSHIRVTAVLKILPARLQEIFETAILALGFLVMILMAWKAFPFALESFEMREVHMSVDVPIWPIKFIFFLGWSLLGVQFFIEFINRVLSKLDPRGFEQVREGE